MTFFNPIWLLLALPLAAVMWRFPLPSRTTIVFRIMVIGLTLFAVAGLSIRLPSRAGIIVVVADRSRSMPQNCDAGHKELIDLLQNGMGSNDRLAVLSFGQTVAIEQKPDGSRFTGFTNVVNPEGSNLGEAVDAALALVPKESPGRILILSDGRWTGRDPRLTTTLAANCGVAIDYRHVARPTVGDLAIARVDAPTAVGLGEGFLVTTWVQSPSEQTIKFEVNQGNRTIASGERKVVAGLNRLSFRDIAERPGAKPYHIRVTGPGEDPIPENNVARVLVGISGPKPILHIIPGPSSGLTGLLRAGGLSVVAGRPEEFEFSPLELSAYSAVILENIPAEKIGERGMEMLAAWVKASGSGLMMTGGRDSFGSGGYYKSPIEPILPVSLELRQEHRKLSVAIVVVLDRSGSMAVPAGGGKVKMDLANLGTAKVLDSIGANDEFGCIAVDTLPHTIAQFGRVTTRSGTRDKILGIQSMGGGIFIDVALVAGLEMIVGAKAKTKHIILFADAADSEQPGNYKEILEKARKAGVTVSAIGLGTLMDKDVWLLKDIAARGNGRFSITNDPAELPKLFAEDSFLIARSTFLETPVKMQPTIGLTTITGRQFALDKRLGGYNLCYPRPEASLGAFTLDEYGAPATAWWQSGSGRVLCFTGEADGRHAGEFARSADAGNFYTSLARWTAGESGMLGNGMAVTQELRNGIHRVQLHLDPERKSAPFSGDPSVSTLRAKSGGSSRTETTPLSWIGPDTLMAEIALEGEETVLSTVMVPGQKPQQLSPACLPYSPEYSPDTSDIDRGRATLEHLAHNTGGVERLDLGKAWKDLPKRPRFYSLTPWLLLAAILFLLMEVLDRRTGFVSQLVIGMGGLPRRFVRFRSKGTAAHKTAEKSVMEPVPVHAATTQGEAPPTATKTQESEEGVLDALRKVRDKTKGRSDE